MRVLILNTSEKNGGAAVAANRLMDALNNNGVKAKMLVRDKVTDRITVVGLRHSLMQQWRFLWERWVIFCHLHFSKTHLFEIDIANTGTDITGMREFEEADVIHIHWINQGFLSLGVIKKILDSGKPVVWTMHDMWPCTAICHHARECAAYRNHCHSCPFVRNGAAHRDLSYSTFDKKRRLYEGGHIHFVTCSKWLEQQARSSALLCGHPVCSIPNPINTSVFRPHNKQEARKRCQLPLDKKLILFGAVKATDKRKGLDYLVESCRILIGKNPESRDSLAVVAIGNGSRELQALLPLRVYPLDYVSDEHRLVDIYNAVDMFVTPSLEENLPNTIMEAMACGVPCVGFNVGGIPEMIDHQINGYVAKFRDAADFAAGIQWVLCENKVAELSDSCQKKVAANYSQRSVALKYTEVYNQALAFKRYKI